MKRIFCIGVLAASCSTLLAADPSEVDSVVAAVKAGTSNFRGLCQSGPDGIRKAVNETIVPLVVQGKIKGNPQEVGAEAGQKVGKECRGG